MWVSSIAVWGRPFLWFREGFWTGPGPPLCLQRWCLQTTWCYYFHGKFWEPNFNLTKVLNCCQCEKALISDWLASLQPLGNFSAVTDRARVDELCVNPHGWDTRRLNCSLLHNFAKSRRLRIAGIHGFRHEICCWTWQNNASHMAKEINHILVITHWKIPQN